MIAVIDYHKGNLASVERGLVNAGAHARITDDPETIGNADALVLPGVGAFADAAESIRELGQMSAILDCVADDVPFLGICLGLHLLYEFGEEHAEEDPLPGLGLLQGTVKKLPKTSPRGDAFKIPHVGWNQVDYLSNRKNPLFDGIADREFFYFTHSFVAPPTPEAIATTTHSITFPSVVQFAERSYAVQFHPEKSSDAGARLLENFVKLAS